ncbi:hypothetical protein [Aeromicrobium terrae]|uniref:Uncharacterized protein n=1 Tax=Aeromicrobium terrae TaxID=2498846 RepID=A0A5C8NNE4_9ACTN|nr:hypothetical protein [Aeromicrobium terrae]TXL62676.1 hypothetical protein FHP06_00025 [Aeromicrobium terrae]
MSAQLAIVPAYQPRPPSIGARLLLASLSRAFVVLRLAPPPHTPGEHPLDHVARPELPRLDVAASG